MEDDEAAVEFGCGCEKSTSVLVLLFLIGTPNQSVEELE